MSSRRATGGQPAWASMVLGKTRARVFFNHYWSCSNNAKSRKTEIDVPRL